MKNEELIDKNENNFEDIDKNLKPLSSFEDENISLKENDVIDTDKVLRNSEEDNFDNTKNDNQNCKKIEKKSHKRKKSKLKIFVITLVALFIIGIGSVLFLLYGPYSGFRNWLITTAMTTMNHQYFATWFYSDETIQKVLSENSIIETKEDADLSLIKVGQINFN